MESDTEVEGMVIPKPKFELGDKVISWKEGVAGAIDNRRFSESDGWLYEVKSAPAIKNVFTYYKGTFQQDDLELYRDPKSTKDCLIVEQVRGESDYHKHCADFRLHGVEAATLGLISKLLAKQGKAVILGDPNAVGGIR